jgi:Integrase core domain.
MFTPFPNKGQQVADALMTNFFRYFGVQKELHSDRGWVFESSLMQEVMERLGVSKTRKMPLHQQSYGMVERYVKTIEEHPRKVVFNYQRDWDEWSPIFLLAFRKSTHETTGVTPTYITVFGRELFLPCGLMFRASPDKEQSMIMQLTLLNGYMTSTTSTAST